MLVLLVYAVNLLHTVNFVLYKSYRLIVLGRFAVYSSQDIIQNEIARSEMTKEKKAGFFHLEIHNYSDGYNSKKSVK